MQMNSNSTYDTDALTQDDSASIAYELRTVITHQNAISYPFPNFNGHTVEVWEWLVISPHTLYRL